MDNATHFTITVPMDRAPRNNNNPTLWEIQLAMPSYQGSEKNININLIFVSNTEMQVNKLSLLAHLKLSNRLDIDAVHTLLRSAVTVI